MTYADILICAIIAVVLLARLWAVFGRRNDEDVQRPNPFATPAPGMRRDDPAIVRTGRDRSDDMAPSAFAPLLVAPMSLAGALENIKHLDPSFDEKQFLRNVRATFAAIIDAFSKGDLAPVEAKLGPVVLPHFQAAIAARKQAGETLANRIIRIRDAETSAAKAEDTKATITVRFVSEQENILRDAAGKIISGEAGKIEEITDIWTFARDIASSRSDWQLVETRS